MLPVCALDSRPVVQRVPFGYAARRRAGFVSRHERNLTVQSWQQAIEEAKLWSMDTIDPDPTDKAGGYRSQTGIERQRRLAREAEARNPDGAERRRRLTLEGLADVDAGRLIDDEAMQAWADSLGTDRELPIPQPD